MKEKFNDSAVRDFLPIGGLIFVVVLFGVLTGGRIVQPANLKLLLSQTYMLVIASMGVFFIMSMGCLDFSQGSMLGVACIVVCYLSNINMVLAVLGGMVAGAAIGAINGFFHVKRKMPSFIVTNCNMYIFRGVVAYITTASPVYAISTISNLNTMPFMLSVTVIVLVVGFLIFHFTPFGANLRAIGAGEKAARFAGIDEQKTKFLVYVMAGVITGFAAFINAIKVGSVTSTGGNQLETQILIALVLRGMPISGGAKVRFTNIVIGVLLYKFLTTGLVMMGFTTATQQLIQGIVFLIFVFLFSDRKSIQVIK
ncbi:MAG: ABC transporter permease [Clostridiales bacterium]|nr:ABC transporter permease [Clostridiales bacterium]